MTGDLRDSIAFRASREAAKMLIGEVDALRWLLHAVDARLRAPGAAGVATHLHLDIAEAIVDAHIEELLDPGLTADRSAQLRADPRCLVVVAALHFVATPRCPVASASDDLEILHWATDVARCELPVS